MAYLMCLIPGAMAGAAIAWGLSYGLKHDNMDIKYGPLSGREIKAYAIAAFIVTTFIFTPLLTIFIASSITRNGVEAVWSTGIGQTLNSIMLAAFFALIHRRNLRRIAPIHMCIVVGVFVIAMAWLVPLTYYVFTR